MMMLLRGLLLFIGLIFLWQLLTTLFKLPDYILPAPLQVVTVALKNYHLIINESMITVTETLLGLTFGIILGMSSAIIMSFFRPISAWFLPILIISQALPTFAIAPLLVMWFGYGITSKIIMTVLIIFFPITSAFYEGLKRTDIHWLHLAQTMNAKKWRTFIFIRIPAAFPSLASGIRVATVAAPIGAVVGEWVGASKGLGFLMLNSNARMQIDLMFAALFAIVIFSLLLYLLVDITLNKIIYWEQRECV